MTIMGTVASTNLGVLASEPSPGGYTPVRTRTDGELVAEIGARMTRELNAKIRRLDPTRCRDQLDLLQAQKDEVNRTVQQALKFD